MSRFKIGQLVITKDGVIHKLMHLYENDVYESNPFDLNITPETKIKTGECILMNIKTLNMSTVHESELLPLHI